MFIISKFKLKSYGEMKTFPAFPIVVDVAKIKRTWHNGILREMEEEAQLAISSNNCTNYSASVFFLL